MNFQIFIPYIVGRIAVSMSSSILSVALGWHLYQLTGDPFDLALVGLMQILPVLSLFLITGWVVDHFSRKRILMVCAYIEALSFVALAMIMTTDNLQREWIFTLIAVQGCGRAFMSPCVQAILPNIVPERNLARAVAITTVAWNFASTAGPFVGGLLVSWLDLSVYWVLSGISFCAGIIFTCLPRIDQRKPIGRGLKQILGGIDFIRHNGIVLGSLTLDLFIVLLGSVVALLPVYAEDILNVGPSELGLLRGMPALGAVMMGVAMARISHLRYTGRCLFISLSLFCASIFMFAVSTTLWLSLLALWLYGASDMVSVNVRSTLVQICTPDQLRGRVSAVNTIFISMSNKLGDFRAGSVAAFLPPVATVLLGGVCACGVVIVGYFMFPGIRKLDKIDDAREQLPQDPGGRLAAKPCA